MTVHNSQPLKRKYEGWLDREICDRTWYRVLKNLKALNIAEEQYETALLLLARIKKRSSTVAVSSLHFLEAWKFVALAKEELKTANIACKDFHNWLNTRMKETPPRSQVYKWFQYAGTPYRKDQKYPIADLIIVCAFAYNWQQRKIKRLEADKAKTILDCEFVQEAC